MKKTETLSTPSRGLSLYAWCVALGAFLLVILGGLVTTTNSGDSVPDWPLAFGQLVPPLTEEIRFEYLHRVVAGCIGLMTLVLTIRVVRSDSRTAVRCLALGALVMVLLQALLGGITVLYDLPKPISITHACLAQTFLVILMVLAMTLSGSWQTMIAMDPAMRGRILRVSALTFGFAYVQLITGAFVRHGIGSGLFPHILGALIVLVHAVILGFLILRGPAQAIGRLAKPGLLLIVAAPGQIALGFTALYWTYVANPAGKPGFPETIHVTAHQSLGAVILVLALWLAVTAFRLAPKGAVDGHSRPV